ncbi:MAG: prephenate dehydrogenase [Eubacteriales bacterium]|nr:prephenate dehydrogenase [Eubacteriales bacterium]
MKYELNKDTKILIVGLGLIGGSYAQALTSKGFEVGAIDTNSDSIAYATENHIISHGRCFPDADYVGQFDIIVFSLYPHTFIEWIENNQNMIKSGALITDVTGVKCGVVYKVQDILRGDLEFIGAHPMAGRELSGVRNARKEIFEGANYIVTPTDKNSCDAIDACKKLGELLGFKSISVLSPEKHDEMIGFLSQLTHCIAISLMVCRDSESLALYTGDSFKDLTRIAKINDAMWSELFLLNKDELLSQMNLFSEKFETLRKTIENDDIDTMREIMRLSTSRREYFDNIKKD